MRLLRIQDRGKGQDAIQEARSLKVRAMPDKQGLEELLMQLQMQNQHLQTIMLQRQKMTVQGREIDSALESIEKSTNDIFKSVGPILVKTTKDAIKKELNEEKEEIELRMAALDRQEKKVKEKVKEMQEKFQAMMPQEGIGQGG